MKTRRSRYGRRRRERDESKISQFEQKLRDRSSREEKAPKLPLALFRKLTLEDCGTLRRLALQTARRLEAEYADQELIMSWHILQLQIAVKRGAITRQRLEDLSRKGRSESSKVVIQLKVEKHTSERKKLTPTL
jgi:hypothetical protein